MTKAKFLVSKSICSVLAGNGSTHPAECGGQAESSSVSFSTVTCFWGSCAPATPSVFSVVQWLSIPGPHGRTQTSPFTFTYCPQEFSHIYSQRDLCSLCPGLAGFGGVLATSGHIRSPETSQSCCQTQLPNQTSSSGSLPLTCTHPVCAFFLSLCPEKDLHISPWGLTV